MSLTIHAFANRLVPFDSPRTRRGAKNKKKKKITSETTVLIKVNIF